MASVSRLGYWGFEVSDLAAREHFATDGLGLAVASRQDDGGLRLRINEHASWRPVAYSRMSEWGHRRPGA